MDVGSLRKLQSTLNEAIDTYEKDPKNSDVLHLVHAAASKVAIATRDPFGEVFRLALQVCTAPLFYMIIFFCSFGFAK
jgi:hypothetical protein